MPIRCGGGRRGSGTSIVVVVLAVLAPRSGHGGWNTHAGMKIDINVHAARTSKYSAAGN